MLTGKVLCCTTFYDFGIGGVATYYLRMFKWGKQNGYKNVLYIKKGRCIDSEMKAILNAEDVKIIEIEFSAKGVSFAEKYEIISKDIFLICSDVHCFMHFSKDKRFTDACVVLYALHPRTTHISKNKLVNLIYKKYLVANSESMIFMDEETKLGFINYYQVKDYVDKYYRVGDFIPELDEIALAKKAIQKQKEFNVLTVARMDFPFKGYVYGLIDNIDRLTISQNIQVQVVGDGPQFGMIKQLVEEKRKTLDGVEIKLFGNVPYKELDKFYKNATVFVGGGTTLIEASKYGVPSIVTTDNQMGACCAGYMDEEYDNLGGVISGEKKDVVELLKGISEMGTEEYAEMAKRCYYVVKREYGIDEIMKGILNLNTGRKLPSLFLSYIDCVITKMKTILIK